MNTDNVRDWSVDDVANWLRQEKYGNYAHFFQWNRIDGVALCDLSKEKFESVIRSSMGRDDRASMLWKNINIIKRAKSKNANSNFSSSKNNRKVAPRNLGPPEPPQRDYRTDDYQQEEVGVEEDTYEVFHEDERAENIEEDYEYDPDLDEDFDTFTDDDEIDSDNGEYLEPTDEGPRGPPQIPSRPNQLNASWGQPAPRPLTDLQKGLMRRMSERAVSNIPTGHPEQGHESELYLTPAEDDTYDIPENNAHDDEIYDIPDDPGDNVPTPSSRQPPMSQQHARPGMKQGPRIPPVRTPQFPKPGGHPHSKDPPAPPIPSREPRPITPEEEQEYAFPDDEGQDYIEPEGESGDENYLEPELQPPNRRLQQNIQSRRLPTVPQTGGAPVPPRPEKPSPLTSSVDAPPAIPSRPQTGRRIPNLESKVMPDFPNGTESTRSDPSRSPPRVPRIPTIPSSANDNENENGNSSSDTSRHVKNMRNRFEADNNNTDNSRRPTPPASKFRSKPIDRQYPPPPSSPTHSPASVIQRPVTSGGNSTPRKPGMPPSTSSTASVSSMSSSSSTGSESGPAVRQRKNITEPASWAEMPPLPPSTRRPSQAQVPTPNQSSVLQINERLAPSQPPKPAPSVSKAPPSPSRAPPTQPQKVNELEGHPWYHSDITRQESEKFLNQCQKDGAFIVRNSTRNDPANPYSLALWFNGRVRNLQIRLRPDLKYALGTKKENELAFDTPVQLIEHHMTNSLILAQDEGKTILKIAAPVYR